MKSSVEKVSHPESGEAGEWSKNWTVVLAAAFGMGLLSVPTYAIGLFFVPLENEFGWSRSSIAGGKLFGAMTGLLMGPVIGWIIDRAGPQRLARIGAVLACTCLGMLSLAGPAITSWWFLWALLSMSGLLIKPTVWTAGVSSVFSANRGFALAVALSGTALASTLTPILGVYLIEEYGWRSALVILASIWALVALPVIFMFFDSAHDRQRKAVASASAQTGDGAALSGVAPREGLFSLRFVALATAAFMATLISASYVTSLVPILSTSGLDYSTAGTIAGVMGLTTVVGRLASGYLSDRVNANYVASAVMLMPVGACFLLLQKEGDVFLAVLAALLLGFTLGAKLHFVTYLTTYHFGIRSFGVLFGTISGLFGLATGIGPVVLNYCYDKFGTYGPALMMTIPLSVIASALFLILARAPRYAD